VVNEVVEDNKYYTFNDVYEYITIYNPVLGYNFARFDMKFIIDILHNFPHRSIECIIGNINNFKMVSIRDLFLKFLDVMNYAFPQTLESFVKIFGNIKDLQKEVFV
jgi:uncharacterized protein (DUF1810 family)